MKTRAYISLRYVMVFEDGSECTFLHAMTPVVEGETELDQLQDLYKLAKEAAGLED